MSVRGNQSCSRCNRWILLPVAVFLAVNLCALGMSNGLDIRKLFREVATPKRLTRVTLSAHPVHEKNPVPSDKRTDIGLPMNKSPFVIGYKNGSSPYKDFVLRNIQLGGEKDEFEFVSFIDRGKREATFPMERLGKTVKVVLMEENCSIMDLVYLTARKVPQSESVPKIIHLTWKSTAVPGMAVPWIKKWKATNPDWDVWFWTDQAAVSFMRKFFPSYDVFFGYKLGIERADSIRYFILYKYGGFYADLDIEPLMSLNPLVERYSCGLSQEPDEHARLLRPTYGNKFDLLACNAAMFCAPNHPYFKYVMDNLKNHSRYSDTLDKTGPKMVSHLHAKYVEQFTRDVCRNASHRVGISPPELFIPQYDRLWTGKLRSMCLSGWNILKEGQRKICKYLNLRGFRNDIADISFTTHHWFHTWTDRGKRTYFSKGVDFNSTDIEKVVPTAKIVSF